MNTITKIYSTAGMLGAVLALIISPVFADAATFTAVASGSWSANATWAGGVAPGSNITNDQIIIGSGFNVTADSDIMIDGALASLDVDGTLDAGAHAVAVMQGTVSGTGHIIVDEMSNATAAVILFAGQIDAQTFINSSTSLTLAAATNVEDQLVLDGGVLLVGSGGLTLAGGTQVVVDGGSMSLSGGLFTATQNYTVLYVGEGGSVGLEVAGSGLSGIEVNLDDSNAELMLMGDLMLNGDLDLENGTLNLNGHSLMLNGDIAAGGSGSISVDGSSDIEIHASGSLSGSLNFSSGSSTMGDLVIDIDNGGSVMLGSDAGVSGTLDLQNGFIALGSNDLMVSGSISGGSSTSYVMTNGQGSLMLDVMAGGSSMFPVGTDIHFSPAVLAQASGSASGMFGVSAMNGVLVDGTSGNFFMSSWGSMVDHTWNVSSELSSDIDLDLTVAWEASAEVNGFMSSQSYISHYTNAAWDVDATAAATVNGQGNFQLTRTGITSLSPFAVFDSNTAVGVDEAEELSVSFYPNPAIDVLNYDMAGNTESMQIDVFDAAGKIVLTKTEQSSRGVIDMNDYPAGIYTIRIANENQNQTARIVKQ